MTNNVFPVRPQIQPGESFWSYVIRLAEENGRQPLAILNAIKAWELKYVQRTDFGLLDFSPHSVINLESLAQLAGRTATELIDATFKPLLMLFGVSEEMERSRFLSGMILDSYRFCPLCMKESPYYRLQWRMAPVTACHYHGVSLIDTCPVCNMKLKFRLMETVDKCPHCGAELSNGKQQVIDNEQLEQQTWMYKFLDTLFHEESHHIPPAEVAMRLLYLASNKNLQFDRDLITEGFSTVLPTLLQHARESLSQKRTLHLSFILNTLYEHKISMAEFLHVEVPDRFVQSVRRPLTKKVEYLSCQAPWCDSFQKPGSLVKTGTTLKRRKSGEVLLYYMACTNCGCEYAIDEKGQLQDRMYFIEGFYSLRKIGTPLPGIKQLARELGFTEDKTQRCLAYFCTRYPEYQLTGSHCEIDSNRLELVINEIRKGTTLKSIRRWDCWTSYRHFLVYRFHPDVMRTVINLKRPRPSRQSDSAVKRQRVREVLDDLLKRDEDITIAAVCDIVGVCPETIRGWGCNEFISEAKQQQRV